MKSLKLTDGHFGKIVVRERVGSNSYGKSIWRYECDCGSIKNGVGSDIVSGQIMSCGCRQKEAGRENGIMSYKPGESSAARKAYTRTKQKAKIRGIEFALTLDEAFWLMTDNCHYCGSAPSQICKSVNWRHVDFVYNGIDRVMSSLGYIASNCVACCWICNRAKGALSVKDFLVWVRKIHDYQEKVAENI